MSRRMLARLLGRSLLDVLKLARLHLVRLGEDEMIGDRRVVEHLHDLEVDLLQAMAAVDQHQRPLQHLPAPKVVVDQVAPFAGDILGRLGEAVTGHVDEPETERLADIEEIQLLRTRSEEHTSELQSLMRISYAVFCLKKKKQKQQI